MDGYCALLIGNSTFPADPQNLQELRGPVKDVAALGAALTDRESGLFDADQVGLLVERPAGAVLEEIEIFLSGARREDQLLLYYSGHGLLDERNQLYLAASNTRTDRLRSTSVSAADISEMLESSAARTAVIVLDCCHSGAFKGNIGPANLAGSGRFVLTSCRSGELANDADRRNGTSLFTQHLVDGLTGGVLDLDGDGRVDVDEVYRYVHEHLAAANRQIPQRRFDGSARTPALARRPVSANASLLAAGSWPAPPSAQAAPVPAGEPGSTEPEPPPKAPAPAAQPDRQAPLPAAPGAGAGPPSPPPPSRGRRTGAWLGSRRRLVLAATALTCLLAVILAAVVVLRDDGSPAVPNLPPGPAGLSNPQGIQVAPGAVEGTVDLFIADSGNNRVVHVVAGRPIATDAGTGQSEPFLEGARVTEANLDSPSDIVGVPGLHGVIVDHGGARLLAVDDKDVVRSLHPDDPRHLLVPPITAVVADAQGILYIATETRVVRLDPRSAALTPLAGTEEKGSSGDGDDADKAQLDHPSGLVLDPDGTSLLIADCGNDRVRKVDLATKQIKTVAGNPNGSYREGGPATQAHLSCPRSLALGPDDAVYLIDSDSYVRKVAGGVITTVAGPVNPNDAGFYDDGRPAIQTTFRQLRDIAVDDQNRLYLSDGINRVRLVDSTGVVSTVA